MIIYLHGFGSSAQASKARAFRTYCEAHHIAYIAPSLPSIPDLAIQTLSELIEAFQAYEPVYLIGSSLGGYYALYLSDKYQLKAVLINPAIDAATTLEKAIGKAINYYDHSSFEWNQSHVEMLENYEIEEPDVSNLFVLLQTGDEVLDYEEAFDILQGAKIIVEEGGNHSFVGIEHHFKAIMSFLRVKD